MNETTDARDPAEIERDIRRTQDQMSATVDRIGDQLSPRNLVNALLDKAESNNVDARMVLDGARRNPLALAMIAGGAIWLISDNDAKLPSHMPSFGRDKAPKPRKGEDIHHRDYVAHMQQVEWRDGEDMASYQRRRDIARANFLMLERRHDEDEAGFRQRLDDLTEKFRNKRHAWAEQGSHAAGAAGNSARSLASSARSGVGSAASSARSAASSAASSARQAAGTAGAKAQDLFTSNPLIGGLAAAAVGAILGTIIPITETEEQQLGSVGEKARDLAAEQKDKLTGVVREKKDELVHKVEESANAAGSSGQQQGAAANMQSGSGQSSHANDAGQPAFQQAASQGQLGQPGGTGGSTDQRTPRSPGTPDFTA